MEAAPVSSPRAPGRSKARDAAPVPSPRARGSGKMVEEASGSAPRARGRESAATGRSMASGPTPHARSCPSRMEEVPVPPPRAPGVSKARDTAPVRPPRGRSSSKTRDAANGAGIAAGGLGDAADGGDTSVAEDDPTATARSQILQDMTNLLYPQSTASSLTSNGDRVPEVAVDITALLAASTTAGCGSGEGMSAGTGGGASPCGSAGGVVRRSDTKPPGYVMPVVVVPTVKPADTEEDKRITIAKIIYGVLLFGSLGFAIAVSDAMVAKGMNADKFWITFGSFWAILSVGFHVSLSGSMRAFTEYIAHLSFILFSALVIFFAYLHLPNGRISLIWLIIMECIIILLHFLAWQLVRMSTNASRKTSAARVLEHNNVEQSEVIPQG